MDHFSISAAQMYDRCGLQYYFRYLEGIKIPPSGSMVQGRSFDRTESLNFSQKIESEKDVPLENAKDVFSSIYDEEIKEAKLDKEEDPGKLKDQGMTALEVFHTQAAPSIQPASVQEKNEVEVAGVPFLSVIDLIDKGEVIHDLKYSGKSPSKDAAKESIQLTAYDFTFRRVRNHVPVGLILDYTVGTKVPKVVRVESEPRSETQLKVFEEEIGLKKEAIEKGVFLPASLDSWVCSEKWCGYFHLCAFGAKRKTR